MGRGRHAKTIHLMDVIMTVTEPRQPITVRGIAYQLFDLKLLPDVGKNSTDKVSDLTRQMREEAVCRGSGLSTKAAQSGAMPPGVIQRPISRRNCGATIRTIGSTSPTI